MERPLPLTLRISAVAKALRERLEGRSAATGTSTRAAADRVRALVAERPLLARLAFVVRHEWNVRRLTPAPYLGFIADREKRAAVSLRRAAQQLGPAAPGEAGAVLRQAEHMEAASTWRDPDPRVLLTNRRERFVSWVLWAILDQPLPKHLRVPGTKRRARMDRLGLGPFDAVAYCSEILSRAVGYSFPSDPKERKAILRAARERMPASKSGG